jgi:hypothetical protein
VLDLLTFALKSIIDHGGVMGALVVVCGAVIFLQWRSARADIAQRDAMIAQLQLGADPERIALRKTIADLQEKRVQESHEREAASKVAIERAASAMDQVSGAIGDQTDAIRDFENLIRRRRGGT